MTAAAIRLSQDGTTLICSGEWTLPGVKKLPLNYNKILPPVKQFRINLENITTLDTVGAFRLRQLIDASERAGKQVTLEGLSERHQAFLELVQSYANQLQPSRAEPPPQPVWLILLGRWTVVKLNHIWLFLAFVGEIVVRYLKINRNGLRNLWQSGLKVIQTAGCQALPIVATMSFLVGIVLAYQLGVQLKVYGADIYVVEASGIAILREFAPLMTAVLIAGRTSTAFAALIGTMKVNDELDALSTMGISTVERLVLPRIAGLLIALPLLVVWSSLFGLLGSMITVKGQLHIGYHNFLSRFAEQVNVKQYILGLIKTPFFALIISIVGCFQGFQTGITADSVGLRTTAAAVQAIFLIIVIDAFFSMLYSWFGL